MGRDFDTIEEVVWARSGFDEHTPLMPNRLARLLLGIGKIAAARGIPDEIAERYLQAFLRNLIVGTSDEPWRFAPEDVESFFDDARLDFQVEFELRGGAHDRH